jgi:hypothetical protein
MGAGYGNFTISDVKKKGLNMIGKIVISFCALFLLLASCCYPIRYDGPYKGRVVEAETGKPIEDVVVLGVWYKEITTAAGGVSSYYDAAETVTDKNGEFEINGLGLKILTNVGPMNILIFKAGYEYVGMGPWESFREDEILRKRIKWDDERAIIPLKKLTLEERKSPPSPPSQAPLEKVILMLKEIDKSDMERNLSPRKFWGGKHYD